MAMKLFDKIVVGLVGIGALNWGLTAMNYNIVEKFLPDYAKYVYYAIGAAGAYTLYFLITENN